MLRQAAHDVVQRDKGGDVIELCRRGLDAVVHLAVHRAGDGHIPVDPVGILHGHHLHQRGGLASEGKTGI